MKLFKSITMLKWLPALMLCLSLASCDLSENEEACLVETRLTFHFSRNGTTLLGQEVPSLSVFVFDEGDKFVGRWDEMNYEAITDGYTMTLPLPPATYRFVVWGGLVDSNYYLSTPGQGAGHVLNPVVGQTSLQEFAVRVARNTRNHPTGTLNFVDHVPGALFFGDTEPVTVEPNTDRNVGIELVKYTNDINLTIIGLPERTTRTYSHFDINLHASNGGYGFGGELASDAARLTYPQHNASVGEPQTWTATLHTLRPVFGKEHKLEFYNTATDEEYYSADLLEDIIRKVEDGSGNRIYNTQEAVDMEDTYNVTVDLRFAVGVAITVNGWTVNSFGGDIQ